MNKDSDDSRSITKEMNGNCIAFAAILVPLIRQTIIETQSKCERAAEKSQAAIGVLFFILFMLSSSFDNSLQSITTQTIRDLFVILFTKNENNKTRSQQQHRRNLNGITTARGIEGERERERGRNFKKKKKKLPYRVALSSNFCVFIYFNERMRGW